MAKLVGILILLPLLLAGSPPQEKSHPETCPTKCSTCKSGVDRSLRYISANLKDLYGHPKYRFDEKTGTPYATVGAAIAGLA